MRGVALYSSKSHLPRGKTLRKLKHPTKRQSNSKLRLDRSRSREIFVAPGKQDSSAALVVTSHGGGMTFLRMTFLKKSQTLSSPVPLRCSESFRLLIRDFNLYGTFIRRRQSDDLLLRRKVLPRRPVHGHRRYMLLIRGADAQFG